MAYAALVTWRLDVLPTGLRRLHLRVVESDVAAASQWDTFGTGTGVTVQDENGVASPVPMFRSGDVRLKALKVSGDATTISPRGGRASGDCTGTMDEGYAVAAAASFHHEPTPTFCVFAPPSGAKPGLFGRSVPDAGTNNVVHTELVIDEVSP